MKTTSAMIAAFGASIVLIASGPVFAHAHLVSSTPVANAALAVAPKSITLTFNEKLAPAFSKFELTMPEHGGMAVAVKTSVSKDNKSIVGVPQAALAKGAYTIHWTAASADGHRMTGELAFKVN